MATTINLQRDIFVNAIFEAASKNKDIYFITADFGAQALDRFRAELGEQFIHAGICEQNMVDLAAGLALSGKISYIYAMVPFVTFRCFEQIKIGLATMNLPVTVLGVGSGYSYDDAGPTHYATEDIGCMRALGNIEILSPSDSVSTYACAKISYENPKFRYIRLDRKPLPSIYKEGESRFLEEGICEIERGDEICVITNGYMMQKVMEAKARLAQEGIHIGVADIFKIKPVNAASLKKIANTYKMLVTVEEHFLSGGIGSAIAEICVDFNLNIPLKRIGIEDAYHMDNGGRDYLHKLCRIDVDSLVERIKKCHSELMLKNKEPIPS